MCDILVNDILDELREENNRLNNDLSFQTNINKILENIKNYSIILKNNCICGENIEIFKKLNDLEIEYKILKTKRNANKTDGKQSVNYMSIENTNPLNESIKSDVIQNNSDIEITSPSITTRSVNRTAEQLNKTKESSEPKTTPICNECQQMFDTALDLVLHVNRHHKDVESFVCHECNQVFDSRDVFSMHLREHQINEDKSRTNSKPKFKTITDYLRSYRKPITTSTPIEVDITENKPKFDFISDLLKPGTSSEGSDNSSVVMPIKKIKMEPNFEASQEFRCHSCLKGFDCDDDLGVHVRESHPNLVCRQCNEWFYSKDDISSHVLNFHKTPNQIFSCDSCNFSTTSKSSLNEHTNKNHCTEHLFQCNNEECGDLFKTKQLLNGHKRNCIRNLRIKKQLLEKQINDIFCCDFCEYKTPKIQNLDKHRKRQHFKLPLVCDINGCGKTFNRKDNLLNHQKVHTKIFNSNQLEPTVFESTTQKNVMEMIGQHSNCEQTPEQYINSSFGEEVKLEFISDSDNESNIKSTEIENYSFDFSNRLKNLFNNKKKTNGEQKSEDFKCDFPNCGKILSRKDLVNRHKRRVHKQYIEKIEKVNPNKERVQTNSAVIKNPKITSNNSNQFKKPSEGVSNDSAIKPFACNIEGCRYSTHKKRNLCDHLRRTHKSGLKFVCNYPNCKRRFDSQLILKQHMNCHKNRFVCRWSGCQFRTNTFAKLNDHKRTEKHSKD